MHPVSTQKSEQMSLGKTTEKNDACNMFSCGRELPHVVAKLYLLSSWRKKNQSCY